MTSLDEIFPPEAQQKLDLTAKERQRFAECLKQPEFLELLKEYAQEISDPAVMKEREEYLKQLEREQRYKNQNLPKEEIKKQNQILVLKPEFCSKIKVNDEAFYVNLCSNDLIDLPVEINDSSKGGTNYKIPLAMGHVRTEESSFFLSFFPTKKTKKLKKFNKKLKEKSIIEVAFHPKAFEKCVFQFYKNFLTEIAWEHASKQFKTKFDTKNFKILKKVSKGEPLSLSYGKNGPEAQQNENQTPEPVSPVTEIKKPVPKYEIIHQGEFDMSEHTLAPINKNQGLPKALILRIKLEKLESSQGVDLDIQAKEVVFKHDLYETLRITLPFAVNDEKGKAQFLKNKKILELTLPVIPPTRK